MACDCGNIIWRLKDNLYGSTTPSCGCAIKDVVGLSSRYKKGDNVIHGLTNSSEYTAWQKMISRCEDKTQHGYERYGGRGITIFKPWRDNFFEFYKYVGPKPSPKHSIGRIDYDKNYEPGNVRWETLKQQGISKCTNRLLEYKGVEMPLIYWIDTLRLPIRFLTEKTLEGWSVEECETHLRTPNMQKRIFSAVARNKFRSQYWAGTRYRERGVPRYVAFEEYQTPS